MIESNLTYEEIISWIEKQLLKFSFSTNEKEKILNHIAIKNVVDGMKNFLV